MAECVTFRYVISERDLKALFSDSTGSDAAGTDFNFAALSIDDRVDLLEIGPGDLFSFIVCMTYIVADKRFFAADFTNPGHFLYSMGNLGVTRGFNLPLI